MSKDEMITDGYRMTKDLHKAVFGNGQPGLITRVTQVETKQKDCQDARAAEPANRSNWIALAALVVCAIGIWLK